MLVPPNIEPGVNKKSRSTGQKKNLLTQAGVQLPDFMDQMEEKMITIHFTKTRRRLTAESSQTRNKKARVNGKSVTMTHSEPTYHKKNRTLTRTTKVERKGDSKGA